MPVFNLYKFAVEKSDILYPRKLEHTHKHTFSQQKKNKIY